MGELFSAAIMLTIVAGAIWMFQKTREGLSEHRAELDEDRNRQALCSRMGWQFRRTKVPNWSFSGRGLSVRSPESRWSISGSGPLLGTWRLDFRSDAAMPLRFFSRGKDGTWAPRFALVHRSMRERESGRLMRGLNAAVVKLMPVSAGAGEVDAWDRLFSRGGVIPVARPEGYEWIGLHERPLRSLREDAALNTAFAELVETLPGKYLMDQYNSCSLSLLIANDGAVRIEGSVVTAVSADAVARLMTVAERAATLAAG